MKSSRNTLGQIVIAILTAFVVPAALAQGGMGQSMGQSTRMPRYDTSTVVTINGTVQEVQEATMRSGKMGRMSSMGYAGLHLIVKTGKETSTVLAGPSWFTKDKGFSFSKGDEVKVTGSRVKYDGTEAIIAREIKKGGKTLTLRNEKGVPKWSRSAR